VIAVLRAAWGWCLFGAGSLLACAGLRRMPVAYCDPNARQLASGLGALVRERIEAERARQAAEMEQAAESVVIHGDATPVNVERFSRIPQ
jgi:hypothetical protein